MSETLQMLPPGSAIGILGTGQLGRMLALAAAPLGFKTHVFGPEADGPATQVADRHFRGAYDDQAALREFAAACHVITYEFENIPADCVRFLTGLRPVHPGVRALEVAQDRLTEKDFINGLKMATAPYVPADTAEGARAAFIALGGKDAIVKTRRLGYDGKGQARVASAEQAVETVARFGVPCILEGIVPFRHEASIIATRGMDGRIEIYDPVDNVHRDGILRETTAPSRLPARAAAEAWRIGGVLLDGLKYVGTMGVELFVLERDRLVVNEIAPRVHNSGHWTLDACAVSQFEQHIRAVAGWPLKPAVRFADCVMENLIGEDMTRWQGLAAEPNAALHLYGKTEARPGRKMGHVNRILPLGRRR